MRLGILGQGKMWLLGLIFLFSGVMEANATIYLLDDKLEVSGFVRQMFAYHTGGQNPNNVGQEDNNSINLSRSLFMTEWTYKPNRDVKIFAKLRITHDQTDMLDSNLMDYNAFPRSTEANYGTYLRPTDDDNYAVELWELYADLRLGDLWCRLGKQQIVWGEMMGGRIMDIINPLDMSWHFLLEPEEFENIRIPQWSLRAMYNIPLYMLSWLNDIYVEGFINPGDFVPEIYPDFGAPYNFIPVLPPIFNINDTYKDVRGEEQFGLRLGARIGQVFATLNYLYLYTAGSKLDLVALGPPPFNFDAVYTQTDIFGLTMNYAFDIPINTTVTYEGTYSPDEPYYDAKAPMGLPAIREMATIKHALRLDRKTFVFPTPVDAMSITLQYMQTIIIGDEDNILGGGSSEIENTKDSIFLSGRQDFWHDNITVSFKVNYDLDGCYKIDPGCTYRHGDYWVFDLFGSFMGGSEKRPGRFGSMHWVDEVYARITFQF